MKGERRFIATIARRLDSLGAITRGQRDSQTAMGSGDQALFSESDNLENIYAKAALRRFYIALWRGHIEGWSLDRFEDATGLKLVYEGNLKEELPPMSRFLNRLLALPIAEQNQLFAELEARIAENIEQAVEAGSFEVGVETVRADSLAIVGRETLYEYPGTGAATDLVEIRRRDRLEPLTAETALDVGAREPAADGRPRLTVNARSKRAAVLLPAPSRMFDDGGVQERVRLVRPATRETMARPELDASNWCRADEATWRTLWEHEIAELPSHRESRFWLAAGLLLPIWDRLPFENMRVRRLATDDGEALIERVLDASQVRAARASFGLDGGPAMTGEEAYEAVMARGTALPLANGWRLARRCIMGADRLEIEGPADTDVSVGLVAMRGRQGRVVRRLGRLVQLRLQRGHPRRQRLQLRHQFRVGRQCRVQPRPERHDQRLLFRAGKLAEVGKRWRVSHPYLDSHLRSSIKENQHLGIKPAKNTIRGAAWTTPGEQLPFNC